MVFLHHFHTSVYDPHSSRLFLPIPFGTRKEQKKQQIPLNIVLTYPVRWGTYKIFRDYVQNFYDSVGSANWSQRFHYAYKDETLSMRVENETFSYEWLLHIGAGIFRIAWLSIS